MSTPANPAPSAADNNAPTPEPCKKNDPVFLTDTPTPTPFTIRWTQRGYVVSKPNIEEAEVVLVSEHQAAIAAKDAEIARRKAQLDMWASAAMDGNAAIAQQTARAEKAKAEVCDALAAFKRIRSACGVGDECPEAAESLVVRAISERDALRAEVERLKAERKELVKLIQDAELHGGIDVSDEDIELWRIVSSFFQRAQGVWDKENSQLRTRLGTAEAALAAAKQDTERLDWLETQDVWIGIRGEYEVVPDYACGGGYTMKVRAAIDAARKAQP